jgi:hypothetical protein
MSIHCRPPPQGVGRSIHIATKRPLLPVDRNFRTLDSSVKDRLDSSLKNAVRCKGCVEMDAAAVGKIPLVVREVGGYLTVELPPAASQPL